MRIIKCICVCCHVAFLEALNAAHHPLALYPPQQIRTDSFSQAFFDYLRAIDRLLSMPSLLQQRSDLQAQLPEEHSVTVPSVRSSQVIGRMHLLPCRKAVCVILIIIIIIIIIITHTTMGVPQDGYEHCVAGDACNKPSRYAGVAKATRDLEQHTDTYLDRTRLEGAVQQLHDSGQLSLSGAFAAARATTEATGAGADAAVVSARLAGVDSTVPSVHELGLQRDRMGQSDKDTRAASNAIKAKLRTARQLLKEAALYQALGSGDAAAVSMVRGEPAPWAEASTATPYGKLLHYGRQLHHLQSDRDRCVEQQAMLRIEHSRLLVWLQHMIVVCKGACSEPEAHGEAEYLVPLVTPFSAGTSLEANLKHITVTLATWDAVWEVYLDPKWARQRLRLYGAQDRALEQFFKKLEEGMAKVSMQRHGRAKQLVVFFGAATIGTGGGWGADAVLRACRKVVCRPRGKDQDGGRVVLVDEHRTSRVSSEVNGQQPCERQLNKLNATRPAGWKPPAGQVEHRLVRPAWSQERGQPVRGMMWCPVVAPRRPPQAPRSGQAATQPAASEPGPSTPPPAKRSKPAAEPTKGKGKGKAAKAKPAPQPGRWLDRDCNAALNMQRIGESRWRPLELCYWPDQGALPAKGKEYPGLGYKRLRDKPPKAQEQQQQPAEAQYNKQALKAMPLPLTCTTIQVRGILPLALVHTLGNTLTNISLGAVAVSFTHTIKALEPLFSVLLSAVFLGETPHPLVLAALLPIIGGVALASASEATFNWTGFLSAMGSNLTFQSRNVLSKKLMTAKQGSGPSVPPLGNVALFGVMTLLSALLLLPVSLAVEGQALAAFLTAPPALAAGGSGVDPVAVLVQAGLAGICFHTYQQARQPPPHTLPLSTVSYMILARVSPVTHSIGNCVKRVVVIVASVIFFRNPISTTNAIGTAIALAGVFAYSQVKRLPKSPPAAPQLKTA
ncbi:hypothetical protein QJQ45_022195 [Haematococcus lacustris]|nr:hypothetical protein QJQ45_022195 [Haematococcus lacustris]